MGHSKLWWWNSELLTFLCSLVKNELLQNISQQNHNLLLTCPPMWFLSTKMFWMESVGSKFKSIGSFQSGQTKHKHHNGLFCLALIMLWCSEWSTVFMFQFALSGLGWLGLLAGQLPNHYFTLYKLYIRCVSWGVDFKLVWWILNSVGETGQVKDRFSSKWFH